VKSDEAELGSLDINKKIAPSVLKLSFAGNIGGYDGSTTARWYFLIDGKECTAPTTIDMVRWEKSGNLFAPAYLVGFCEGIPAGKHTISVNVGRSTTRPLADTTSLWASTATLEVRELCPQF